MTFISYHYFQNVNVTGRHYDLRDKLANEGSKRFTFATFRFRTNYSEVLYNTHAK